MKSKFKKFLKILLYIIISLIFIFLMFFTLFHFGFLNNFSSIRFNKNKLTYANSQIKLYDINDKLISNENENSNIELKDIPTHLKDAFISIEDKSFFKHSGVNYKRILGAAIHNFKSFKLKEGASTISQQLIKNTHLTNDKTFKRKINELLLSKQMEKELSKNEILVAYLNAIYFGSGSFGINQASQRYFSKKTNELSLEESATLAGIIKSPKNYSPISNPDNCLKRRNLVLKEMYKNNKITKEQYNESIKSSLNLNINKNFLGNNSYYGAAIDEACSILKLTEKDLLLKEYEIYTYKDENIQNIIENEVIEYKKYTNNFECDCAVMSVNNQNGGINGFFGKSDFSVLSLKRQPGSTFKPIISYAPALEYNIINPLTPILDNEFSINNYSPKNYNNKYYGWISAKKALSKSLNAPSVKILDYVGIEKAKSFCQNLNINFNKNDVGHSIALGGLTDGLTIKELTNCYQSFANNGKFIPISFVKEIRTKNGKIIYKHNNFGKQVMKESTAFLINDILKDTVKNGTAKKLNLPNTTIASKTGTVGKSSVNKENTDVWNISYTKENTLSVWFGSTNKNLLPKYLTGGNTPTSLAQEFYKKTKLKNNEFEIPKSIKEIEIDQLEYDYKQKVKLANENTPDRFKIKAYFSIDNLPKEETSNFTKIDDFNITAKVINKDIEISFEAKKFLKYEVIKQDEDLKTCIATIQNKEGIVSIKDTNVVPENFYEYHVIAKYNDSILNKETSKRSNIVKLFLAQNNPLLYIKSGFYLHSTI